jgi:hypothetical protein
MQERFSRPKIYPVPLKSQASLLKPRSYAPTDRKSLLDECSINRMAISRICNLPAAQSLLLA